LKQTGALTCGATDGPLGWKPIPLSLKILAIVLVLWLLGALANLPNLLENGLPLMGFFVYSVTAAAVVLILDIIGPLVFLFALWTRKSWAVIWAFAYMGFFIANSVVALFTVRVTLGLLPILIPALVSACFVIVIYRQRGYFAAIKAG
jgi:hypothetical protein